MSEAYQELARQQEKKMMAETNRALCRREEGVRKAGTDSMACLLVNCGKKKNRARQRRQRTDTTSELLARLVVTLSWVRLCR